MRIFSIKIWSYGLLLLTLLGVTFLFTLGRITHQSLIKQHLHREEIIATAQAGNITSFFQDFGDSIAVLGQLKSMERVDETTLRDMDLFMQQWLDSKLVGGVVFINNEGIVKFNSNDSGTRDVGSDLSDRDYFIWAKNQTAEGKYYIGKPVVSRFGASKGQSIVVVASPVFREDVILGVVASAVRLRPLTQRFLGLMKTADTTNVYMTDLEGNLIYNSAKFGDLGPNIFDTYLPGLKSKVDFTKSGSLQTKTHIVAYSPVKLNGQNWALMTSSPFESGNFNKMIYMKLALLLVIVISSMLFFGIAGVQGLKPGGEEKN